MTARNRVTPWGEVVTAPGRGAWMGNRGRLHDASLEVTRRWDRRAWLTCALSWRGRRLPLLEPGHDTQLFFLDEALALAAGHRPCARCRRPAYDAYRAALGEPGLRAPELDARLHAERLDGRGGRLHRRLHRHPWRELPGDAVVVVGDEACRVVDDALLPWVPVNAWGLPRRRPLTGSADVLTPPTSLAVLAAGWRADYQGDPSVSPA